MISNSNSNAPNQWVLVYNDGLIIVADQLNQFQETSTSFTLEIFTSQASLDARVSNLGLTYPPNWDQLDSP